MPLGKTESRLTRQQTVEKHGRSGHLPTRTLTRMSTKRGSMPQDGAETILKRAIETRMEAKALKIDLNDSHDERWQRGKNAAALLESMLEEPPQFKALVDHERIKELKVMTESEDVIERICGWNGLILKNWVWHCLIGMMIFTNCILIGVEQSLVVAGKGITACEVLEHVFLAFYTVELVMNLIESGIGGLLYDRWLQLEASLVFLGILSSWIITPIFGGQDGLGGFFVVRTVRLLRLARMVRILKQKELWTLVSGFLSSVGTMTYTSILLLMVIYGFSCVGMEVIRNHSAYDHNLEFRSTVDEHFVNLPRIMLTLVRFIFMDSVGAIYTPLVTEDPSLMLYFLGIILAVAIVLMNIVTAVIVNTALETNMLDKEKKTIYVERIRRGIVEELGKLFEFFDVEGRQVISKQELLESPPEACALLCKLTGIDRVDDLFMQIDSDGDGKLTYDEFCEGICSIVSSEAPQEIRDMQQKMQTDFARLFDVLDRMERRLEKGVDRISKVERIVTKLDVDGELEARATDIPMRMERTYKTPTAPEAETKEVGQVLPIQAPAWALKLLSELQENASVVAKFNSQTGTDAAQGIFERSSYSLKHPYQRQDSKERARRSAISPTRSIEEEPTMKPESTGFTERWQEHSSEVVGDDSGAGASGGRRKKKLIRNRTPMEQRSPRGERGGDLRDRTKSSLFEHKPPNRLSTPISVDCDNSSRGSYASTTTHERKPMLHNMV